MSHTLACSILIHICQKEKIPDSYGKCKPDFQARLSNITVFVKFEQNHDQANPNQMKIVARNRIFPPQSIIKIAKREKFRNNRLD